MESVRQALAKPYVLYYYYFYYYYADFSHISR